MIRKQSKRLKVFEKYKGHCAYCGIMLSVKKLNVDHIIPSYLGGSNDLENLNPSCRRCNSWKKTYSIEEFRKELEAQPRRLLKSSASARLALDYGLLSIKPTNKSVEFYFEKEGKNE